jgi:hypothetical protein
MIMPMDDDGIMMPMDAHDDNNCFTCQVNQERDDADDTVADVGT